MNKYKVKIPDIEYYEELIKCQYACPVNTASGSYVQSIANEDYEKAYSIARAPNPFVYVCGRVCAHPCEDACRRNDLDEPISIRALKRTATDHHNLGNGHGPKLKTIQKINKKVAVIGAGPSGLSAAHDLAKLGYEVTVFESSPVAGGMLYLGLPVYRLPRDIIKLEVDAINNLGVEIRTNTALGKDFDIEGLKMAGYEAIFIAIGANKSKELNMEGVEFDGVMKGVEFLLNVNLGYRVEVGNRVIVIGGGNVAIDVARTAMRGGRFPEDGSTTMDVARMAIRLGAKEVHVVCLESRKEMPAFEYEVEEAENEGVILNPSKGPKRILGEHGKVKALETISVASIFDKVGKFNPEFLPGTESIIETDTVILAIGQTSDFSFIKETDGIEITKKGTILVNKESLTTTSDGIFAGGDVAFGPRLIIDAVADGQKVARSIHTYLSNKKYTKSARVTFTDLKNHTMPEDYDKIKRHKIPTLALNKRIGIAEVELSYSEEDAINEGKRCLKCNVNTVFNSEKCVLCAGCVDICPNYCLKIVSLSDIDIDNDLFLLVDKLQIKDNTKCLIKDETLCIRCGLCAKRCPTKAITMEKFEYESEFK